MGNKIFKRQHHVVKHNRNHRNVSSVHEGLNRPSPPPAAAAVAAPNRPKSERSPPPSENNQEMYEQWMSDLLFTQDYLQQQLNDQSLAHDLSQADIDGLQTALSVKQDELCSIRSHVRNKRDVPEHLIQTLSATEDLCREAGDRLMALNLARSDSSDCPVLPNKSVIRQNGARTPAAQPPCPVIPNYETRPGPVKQQAQHDDHSTNGWIDTNKIRTADQPTKVIPSRAVDPAIHKQLNNDDTVNQTDDDDDDDDSRHSNEGLAPLSVWINDLAERQPGGRKSQPTRWKIERNTPDLLETVFALYEKAKDRELQRNFQIIFEGEEGVDGGALTREFFHMSFEAATSAMFKDCNLFEGEMGHLLPDVNVEHLVGGFKNLGKMIAHSVRQGCRGMPGLSPAIQYYIARGSGPAFIEELTPPVSIDDVADLDLRQLLIKLHGHEDLTEKDKMVLYTWTEKSDCRVVLKKETSDLIVQTLLIFYVFKSRIRQIEAIVQGLELFDLRRFLRQNPSPANMAIVFPSPQDVEISPELFMTRVQLRGNANGEHTLRFLRQFLDELHQRKLEGRKISHLVQFISGAPFLPEKITLFFNADITYPSAHACFNELELPAKHKDYPSFRDAILVSLEHGGTFTME